MKAQVSTEFMVFVGMAVVLLMIYMAIANNFLNIAYTQQEIISAQDLAKILKNEINLASRVENGYIKEFQLPYQVDNKEYNIETPPNAREVSISYEGSDLDFTEMLSTEVSIIGGVLVQGNIIFIKKLNNDVFISSPYCMQSQEGNTECRTGNDCKYGEFSVQNCLYKCNNGNWNIEKFCDTCNGNCISNSCGTNVCKDVTETPDLCTSYSGNWVTPYDPCLINSQTGLYLCCNMGA